MVSFRGSVPHASTEERMIDAVWQVLRFGTVGLVNTAVGLLAIYVLMYVFDTNLLIANASGYIVGLLVSFLLNRTWTFRSDQRTTVVLLRYIAAALFSYSLNFLIVLYGDMYSSVNQFFLQIIGISFYTVSMFILCRYFVFAVRSH
ncbi:GtrA family protein [Agrobacterium tumefaciens]|nr:GtrA family protein [Agrobacterium sp. ICMP 6402]NTZ93610.1 GtrA family protein [Agrobacterium tumefaciens]